jgi:glycosyltransferase involved in cell wall biosynthesis
VRVLIATQHLNIVGGIETYLRGILPRLAAAGYELGVLGEHGAAEGGILAGCAPGVPLWVAGGRPAPQVVREVAGWRPDVVYLHGFEDPRLEAALAEQFPTVFFAHDYHGTCVSGTKSFSRSGFQTCHRTLGAGCLASYLVRGCGGRNPLTMLRLYRIQTGFRDNLRAYRFVAVASRHMAEEYRRHGVGEERLRVTPLFPANCQADANPPTPRQRTDRILFVGRITPLKGLAYLVAALPRAAAELGRSLTLVVAGDGPERADVAAKARSARIPVEFLSWVTPERRTEEMRAADLLAVPSVWPEPFGLVGIEAACVGLPAVGFAVGGIPDWLIPGESGELAPARPPAVAGLVDALVRALADPMHLQRLREGAWAMAGRFTLSNHLDMLKRVLREAVGDWRQPRAGQEIAACRGTP